MTRQHKHRNYKDYSKVGKPIDTYQPINLKIDLNKHTFSCNDKPCPFIINGKDENKNGFMDMSTCYLEVPITTNGKPLSEEELEQIKSQIYQSIERYPPIIKVNGLQI
jgi:hypothetical protein